MADQKISDLAALTTPAIDDRFEVLDISDTSGAASGTNKRIDRSLAVNLIVRKTADETLNTSTTVQNDNELLFAVAASEIWFVEAFIIYSAVSQGGTMDFKVGWAVPSGATILWGAQGTQSSTMASWGPTPTNTTPTAGLTSAQNLSLGNANQTSVAAFQGIVTVAATPGNVTFQWAQASSNANDLTVKTGSFLRLTRLA